MTKPSLDRVIGNIGLSAAPQSVALPRRFSRRRIGRARLGRAAQWANRSMV